MALEELGLAYEHVPLNPRSDPAHRAVLDALNPNSHMPVLDDDGLIVWESMAINLYLADKCGGPLWPARAADRALTYQWSLWAQTEIDRADWNKTRRSGDDHQIAADRQALIRALGILDRTLEGRDYLLGFKRGLGDKAASMIVSTQAYNTTDPTVDSQVVSLKTAGADVFFMATIPKFSAQAIRKAYDIDWHPQEIVVSVGSSIAGAIKPAGFDAAKGIISAAYQKDPADPQWKDDPAMQAWNVWMDKYNPRVNKSDYYAPYGYNIGYAVVQLLKQCGDNLTRENIMKQASHLDMELPLLLPGIRLKTTPTDLRPIKQMRLVRFDGSRYVLFSDVLASD